MLNCSTCTYLTRTSPEQVFLLCRFWASPRIPIDGTSWDFDRDYVYLHCHVQPEAPACPFHKHKKVSDGATDHPRELLCTR